ncbi:hypothetical protein F2P81_016344 [Scomber scombrus]|uniref:Uncharacterized protein n=1 Tax=Scomber scombrus TaxID=13677 RepID=A0AAV1NKZ7_SCOSC
MSSLLRSDCCSRFQSYQQLSIGDVLDLFHQSQAPSSGDKTNNSQPNIQPRVKPGATKQPDANMTQLWNKNRGLCIVVDRMLKRSKVQQCVKFVCWSW